MKKEYDILDFNLLQPGQLIKCCLDWDGFDLIEDEETGENTDELQWWYGTIKDRYHENDSGYEIIVVDIPELDRQGWGVALLEENKHCIKLVLNEWDD